MADLTAAGDHSGFLARMSAPTPAMWGEAIEVPERNPNSSPPVPIGDTPARTATPGAAMSGFNRSEPVASSGPREEKPAICGTGGRGSPVVSSGTSATWISGSAATFSLSARLSGALTCTVGTECLSVSIEESLRLTRIMPTPPARATSADLATRSYTPRSQTTILPVTTVASSEFGAHRAGSVAPAAAALPLSTTGLRGTPSFIMLAPRNLVPSENSAVP